MSDIDHSNTPLPALEDPTVTRLMVRRHDGSGVAGLLQRSASVATSISVIVPMGGTAGRPDVDGLAQWAPERIRVEVLVMETPDDPGRSLLRDRLVRSGRSWRVLERPPGGRAAALSAAAQEAEHEFVLVGSGGSPPFELVLPALSVMWAEGGDAALLDRVETAAGPPEHDDPAAQLAEWLGLSTAGAPGRLVLMRRWVARWLFNELTRAISPADEVADRARLLGIGIVRMTETVDPTRVPGVF